MAAECANNLSCTSLTFSPAAFQHSAVRDREPISPADGGVAVTQFLQEVEHIPQEKSPGIYTDFSSGLDKEKIQGGLKINGIS